MKIAAIALSSAILGLASLTPVSAAPAVSAVSASAWASGVTPVVQKKVVVKKKHGVVTKKVMYKNGFRPGGHYKHAPHGWHRFEHRPGDWHTRGCVVVGPVWWCP